MSALYEDDGPLQSILHWLLRLALIIVGFFLTLYMVSQVVHGCANAGGHTGWTQDECPKCQADREAVHPR